MSLVIFSGNFSTFFNIIFSFKCCRKRSTSKPLLFAIDSLLSFPECPSGSSRPRVYPPPKPSSSSSPPPSSSTLSSSTPRPTRRRSYALVLLSLPLHAATFSLPSLLLLCPGLAASPMFVSGTSVIRRVLSPLLIALRLISPLPILPFRR